MKERFDILLQKRGINEYEFSDTLVQHGLDELDIIEFVVDLESEFGIQISDELIQERNPRTIGDFYGIVSSLTAGHHFNPNRPISVRLQTLLDLLQGNQIKINIFEYARDSFTDRCIYTPAVYKEDKLIWQSIIQHETYEDALVEGIQKALS